MNVRAKSGVALSLLAGLFSTGCSGLLGLDDKNFDGSGGTSGTTISTGGSGGGNSGGSGGSAGNGGAGGVGGSGGSGGVPADLLDDEFDFMPQGGADVVLKERGWRFTRQEEAYPAAAPFPSVFVEDGLLRVTIPDTHYWFGINKGFLMYKEVTGDFLVVADVASKRLDIMDGIPEDLQSGAGLLARDPASAAFQTGNQHWLAVDRGANGGIRRVHGTWVGPGGELSLPADTALQQGKVAMCRVGSTFTIWSREASGWVDRTTLLSPDVMAPLPPTLQVGVFAYAAAESPAVPSPAGVLGEFAFVHQYDPAGSCNPADHGE